MDAHSWIVFSVAVVGVFLAPGPSTLIGFAHGAEYGIARSVPTALGNGVASIVQAAIASVGMGLLLASSETLFLIIKYAGAAFLVVLGIQLWRASSRELSSAPDATRRQSYGWARFTTSFAIAMSNPESIGFFTSLFPQFLSEDSVYRVQLAVMVSLVGLSAFGASFAYACVGAAIRGRRLSGLVLLWMRRVIAVLFVASGVALLLANSGSL